MTSEAPAYWPTELDLSVLQGLALPRESKTLEPLDTGLAEVTRCIDKGRYREAACAAQRIFETDGLDVRLLGYFLYGYFDEHGLASLAAILETLTGLIQGDQLGLDKNERSACVAFDTTLGWLFGRLLKKLERHEAARDAVFDDWVTACDHGCQASIEPQLEDLRFALKSLLADDARSPLLLERISEWCSHLRVLTEPPSPAIAAQSATGAEPAPEEIGSRVGEAEVSDEFDVPVEAAIAAEFALEQTAIQKSDLGVGPSTHHDHRSPSESGSPAWRRLLAALCIFDELIADGDYLRAAIVAEELEERFANFDPREYFPGRLAPFYRVLSTHVPQLDAIRMEVGEAQWRVLRDHCRVDLAGFRDAPDPLPRDPAE